MHACAHIQTHTHAHIQVHTHSGPHSYECNKLPLCTYLSLCASLFCHEETVFFRDHLGTCLHLSHPYSTALFFFLIYFYKIFITLSSSHPGKLRAVIPTYHSILTGKWCLKRNRRSIYCLIIFLLSLAHLCLSALTSQSQVPKLV